MTVGHGDSLIRLLALDVDGTLLNSRHELTAAVCDSVRRAVEIGVKVVLTSARGPSGLRPVLRGLGIHGHAVTFSGALLCLTHPDRPVVLLGGDRIELAAARAVVHHARQLGVSVGWWEAEDWFTDELDGTIAREAEVIGVTPSSCDLARLEGPPFKLQCMVPMDQIDRLRALRGALPPGVEGHFSNPNYLEVSSAGVDKARGLRRLGELLGIQVSEMAAIGDGENDLTMLRMVGLGVAVGNARPRVLQASSWVTLSNDEDGVAVAIRRMEREGRLRGEGR